MPRGILRPMASLPDMDPAEVAAMDVAFEAGVAEALRRGSSLMMMRSHLGGHPVWTCLYPPSTETAHSIGGWARTRGIVPDDGDLFVDASGVKRAAADLGLK